MRLKERPKPKTLSCSGNWVENVQIFLSSGLVVLVILQLYLQHQYFVYLFVWLVGSLVGWLVRSFVRSLFSFELDLRWVP